MKPLYILLMTMFIDLAGFAMFIPLLNYIVAELGGTILTVGLLITAFSLAQFLCLPAWGRLSDRIGRRPVIMLGLGGAAVAYAVFGLADPALGLSDDRRLLLGVLFLSRIMLGVMSANYAAAYAYVADVTPPEERAQGMGLLGVAFGLGFEVALRERAAVQIDLAGVGHVRHLAHRRIAQPVGGLEQQRSLSHGAGAVGGQLCKQVADAVTGQKIVVNDAEALAPVVQRIGHAGSPCPVCLPR